MPDITQIAASIAVPSLSSALQQAELPLGQAIEAKITQIISDEIIRLTSSIGTFDLKASHPALQPGVTVKLNISQNGNVTLTVLSGKGSPPPATAPAQPTSVPEAPAVIASLGKPQPAPAPTTYSASGQVIQPGKLPPQPQAPQAQPLIPTQQGQNVAVPPPTEVLSAGETEIASKAALSRPIATTATVLPTSTASMQTAASMPSAVSAALGEALAKQGSIAPLLANLEALAKLDKPLPQSLQAAIEEVLQFAQPLSAEVTPQTLQQAIARSGVFYESDLVKLAASENAVPAAQGSAPVLPQMDFKGMLLKLAAVLETLVKEAPPLKNEEVLIQHVAPPRNDAAEAQHLHEATLTAQSTQQEIIGALAKQAESALARVRVLQFASMPAGLDAPEAQTRPVQSWHIDLPMLLGGQGAVIPLTIEREAASREAQEIHHRWRVRFALELNELGAVHALLALSGGLVDVTLWAERRETCDLFRGMAKDLHYALMDEELDVADIEFRAGSPRTAKTAGANLDTRT